MLAGGSSGGGESDTDGPPKIKNQLFPATPGFKLRVWGRVRGVRLARGVVVKRDGESRKTHPE